MARELTITIRADATQARSELKNTEQGVAGVEKASVSAEQTLRRLTGAVSAAFSAMQISDKAAKFVADAGRISDAMATAGSKSAEAFQRIVFAASQAGGSMESVTAAFVKMGDNLGSGNKSTIAALQRIGLSFDEIKRLRPEQQFTAIGNAIAGLQSPSAQLAALNDIMGRGAADLLPSFKAGIEEVGQAAPVMSAAALEAGDTAGDSFDRLKGQINAVMGEALTPLLRAFTALPEPIQIVGAGLVEFGPALSGIALAIMASGGLVPAFSALGTAATAAWAAITGPVGLVIAGIAAVSAAVYYLYQRFSVDLGPAMKQATEGLSGLRAEAARAEAALSYKPALDPAEYLDGLQKVTVAQTAVTTATVKQTDAVTILAGREIELARSINAVPVALVRAEVTMSDGLIPTLNAVGQMTATATLDLGKFENALYRLPPAIQAVEASASRGGGFLSGLTDGFKSMLQGLTGGGGLSGFMQNLGTGIVDGFGRIISGGITSLVNMGIGLAMKGIQKFVGWIANLGGPSEQEKQGRSAAAEFEAQLASTLTLTQQNEAAGEKWKMTVIAVRDALIANGEDGSRALELVKRLWDATREGPEAVQRVIEEITQATLPRLADATASTVGQTTGQFRALSAEVDALQANIETPLTMKISTMFGARDINASGISDGTGSYDGYLTPSEAAERGVAWQPHKNFGWSDSAYRSTWSSSYDSEGNYLTPEEQRALGIQTDKTPIGRKHFGGMVGAIVAHNGLALDEVPTILQTGEGVLSRRGMRALGGAKALNALNSGTGSGGGVSIHVETLSIDGGMSEAEFGRKVSAAFTALARQRGIRFRPA